MSQSQTQSPKAAPRGAPRIARIFLTTGLLCIGAFLAGLLWVVINKNDLWARFAFDTHAEHLPFVVGFFLLLAAGPIRQLATMVTSFQKQDHKTLLLAGVGFLLLGGVYVLAFFTKLL